jgi:hypothetical protein
MILNSTNVNELSDPLNEKALPLFATKLLINHYSPTQQSICDAAWLYKYLILSQEERRLLPANAQMKAGVFLNNVLQSYYASTIWKFGPQRKLTPTENLLKGTDKQTIINKELEEFKSYEPVDEKDRQKKEKYLDELFLVLNNGFAAMDDLNLSHHTVVSERQISIDQSQSSLLVPIVGRTDFELGNAGGSISPSFLSTGIIELKSTWSKAGKLKANGERSFISAKIPNKPSFNHLIQVAMYAAYHNYSVPVFLVYVCKDEYKIFDSSNCADLTQEGLKRCFKILCNTFRRREKILAQFEELSKEEIIKNAVAMIDPNFDHPFAWSNLNPEQLQHAKQLWNHE